MPFTNGPRGSRSQVFPEKWAAPCVRRRGAAAAGGAVRTGALSTLRAAFAKDSCTRKGAGAYDVGTSSGACDGGWFWRRSRGNVGATGLIFPRLGGHEDYAANAAACVFNSNSMG